MNNRRLWISWPRIFDGVRNVQVYDADNGDRIGDRITHMDVHIEPGQCTATVKYIADEAGEMIPLGARIPFGYTEAIAEDLPVLGMHITGLNPTPVINDEGVHVHSEGLDCWCQPEPSERGVGHRCELGQTHELSSGE